MPGRETLFFNTVAGLGIDILEAGLLNNKFCLTVPNYLSSEETQTSLSVYPHPKSEAKWTFLYFLYFVNVRLR